MSRAELESFISQTYNCRDVTYLGTRKLEWQDLEGFPESVESLVMSRDGRMQSVFIWAEEDETGKSFRTALHDRSMSAEDSVQASRK